MKYVLTVALLSISGIAYSKCDSNNFDQCKTCEQLDKAIVLSDPDRGDYYRGALWNGLYASYVRNCQGVAKKLLDSGATPSFGGWNSALPIVISGKWPHENKTINEQWKNLLIKYNVKLDLIPEWGKSPYESYVNDPSQIDYEDIWNELMLASKPAPILAARNIEWCSSEKNRAKVKIDMIMCSSINITKFDDNISTASDIAEAVLVKCEDELSVFSDAIICTVVNEKNIQDEKIRAIEFNSLRKNHDTYLRDKQKSEIIQWVLESRRNARLR
ncbi:hypothetical protein [Providencia sp. SP181]|uniref:hypothetical protein n=1 Tax=Providencia sp. SP181 TaxID=3136277 RepID=UPI003D29B404